MAHAFPRLNKKDTVGYATLALLAVLTSFAVRSVTGRWWHPGKPLVATSPEAKVKASASDGITALATFELENRSNRKIEITNVSASCTCVEYESYTGYTIDPKRRGILRFSVNLPEYGTARTRILVSHTGAGRPVELFVEAEGRGGLPVVREVLNGTPAFIAISSPSEQAKITVRTYEKPNSAPWLDRLTCDLPEADCQMGSMSETLNQKLGIVEREYYWVITWHRLPGSGNFSGALTVSTRSSPARLIPVGRVIGSVNKERWLSPSVAVLSHGGQDSEVITFRDNSATWSVSPKCRVPHWLSLKWKGEGSGKQLLVKLNEKPGLDKQSCTIELVNDKDENAILQVVCE